MIQNVECFAALDPESLVVKTGVVSTVQTGVRAAYALANNI